jgi:hypothetical protein
MEDEDMCYEGLRAETYISVQQFVQITYREFVPGTNWES